MNTIKEIPSQPIEDKLFLPDFCNVYTVFLGVILTELLAFVLVLAPLSNSGYDWRYVKTNFINDLAMISLFIQWVALISMGLLCLLRRWLCRLGNIPAGVLSYLLILLVTGWVSEFSYRLNGYISSAEVTQIINLNQSFLVIHFIISVVITSLLFVYFYQRHSWQKTVLIVNYVIILITMFILTLLITWFFQVESLVVTQSTSHQLFLWRNLGMSTIISAIVLRYFYIQYHWKKEMETTAYARAQALQARIRPHFLFNSMNTIASLIRSQPKQAEQAIIDFAEVFRASLVEAKNGITLQEELAWCQQYLRIESLRLGNRLQVVWKIDTLPKDAILPPLCLQPLIENTIYHGIQPLPEGGTIYLTGWFDGSQVKLEINNPLPKTPSSHQGQQMAQYNIQQRLQLFYGKRANLKVQKTVDTYQVSLIFPYRNHYDENTYR